MTKFPVKFQILAIKKKRKIKKEEDIVVVAEMAEYRPHNSAERSSESKQKGEAPKF